MTLLTSLPLTVTLETDTDPFQLAKEPTKESNPCPHRCVIKLVELIKESALPPTPPIYSRICFRRTFKKRDY